MKILFFIESLRSGGKERRLTELVRVISENPDYACRIVTMDDEIYFKNQIPKNVDIIILKRKYFRKDINVLFKFFKICSEYSPDIIHVWGKMAAIYAIPTKLIFNIPIINSQISDVIPMHLLYNKIAFKFSDFIIANSYAGIEAYNPPKNKSSVIYNGFDFSRITKLNPVEELKNQFRSKSKNIVGMVASFSTLKDYNTFINSGVIVLKEFPETTFLCIGDGDKVQYKKLIPLKYIDNFIFLDSQTEIESIINIFDIGILATYTEGISNSIIEYMALEKPVVATIGGGTSELIIDNETGFLVPPQNIKIMAEKIILLLRDNAKRRLMGQAGKARIRTEFSIENMVNKHIEIYNRFSK